MNIFEAKEVEKHFANHVALNNVSVHVPEGSIYGLLGPNGAGKTTLLRILNQITAPDKGSLLFAERKLKPDDVAKIGYLPEERGLYKKMKVGEQAIYLGRLKGLSRHDVVTRLKYWFSKFEIENWWDKKVEELSKGMQQKVQFITTVLHEPTLLIFDEPFSGFDPINANLLKNEILELQKKGTSIIFSTHNMESVEELCSHISLINKSEIILEGPIHVIRNSFKSNIFQVEFSGTPDKAKQGLNELFEMLSTTQTDDGIQARFKLNNASANQLLEALIPNVAIQSFREIIPTMNEIFIQVVEQANQKPS